MKKYQLKKKGQSGSSILETMIALILMCLIFFGAMQLFQWAMARMFCDYASFYASKAYSLGYAKRTIDKAARIAAIPISGSDKHGILKKGRDDLANLLRLYMSTGNAGIEFPYWDAGGKDPDLRVSYSENPELNVVTTRVMLYNAPYLDYDPDTKKGNNLKKFLYITSRPVNPSGRNSTINHCEEWLE